VAPTKTQHLFKRISRYEFKSVSCLGDICLVKVVHLALTSQASPFGGVLRNANR
jgi:hypothetical protein